MTNPLTLLKEVEILASSQRLNCLLVESGVRGSGVALEELRRVAYEIRLKVDHFRALTSPSLNAKEAEKVDAEHLGRWSKRKGISGKG